MHTDKAAVSGGRRGCGNKKMEWCGCLTHCLSLVSHGSFDEGSPAERLEIPKKNKRSAGWMLEQRSYVLNLCSDNGGWGDAGIQSGTGDFVCFSTCAGGVGVARRHAGCAEMNHGLHTVHGPWVRCVKLFLKEAAYIIEALWRVLSWSCQATLDSKAEPFVIKFKLTLSALDAWFKVWLCRLYLLSEEGGAVTAHWQWCQWCNLKRIMSKGHPYALFSFRNDTGLFSPILFFPLKKKQTNKHNSLFQL